MKSPPSPTRARCCSPASASPTPTSAARRSGPWGPKPPPGALLSRAPPYEPVSRTANFTAYAQDGFSQADQTRLRDIFRDLDRRGSKLMLSNSDAPFIRELYKGYQIDEVSAARAVSCDPAK